MRPARAANGISQKFSHFSIYDTMLEPAFKHGKIGTPDLKVGYSLMDNESDT